MKPWMLLLTVFLVAPLYAQDEALRLDVDGDITIDKSGNVYDYTIKTPIAESVRQLVDRSVRQWKFEPVIRNGVAVHAKCEMDMSLVAVPVANGFRLRIDAVGFETGRRGKRMNAPRYPPEAQRVGIEADVLIAVRIDEKGAVRDLFATQSSLLHRKSKVADTRWVKAFEKSALEAARTWKFEPADIASGEPAETTVIVPVSFVSDPSSLAASGWRPEAAATEKKLIPWLSATEQDYDATGLKGGEALAVGSSPPKLKTAVVGTTL